MARILIADDEPDTCHTLQKLLATKRIDTVHIAHNGLMALELLKKMNFDLAILDIYFPSEDGLEILEKACKGGVQTKIVMMSGQATHENIIQAFKNGARDFLVKPIESSKFLNIVSTLLGECSSCNILGERLDRFLQEHATQISFTLGDLCHHFSISPCYASRLFHEHTGKTFRDRLASYRIQKAKNLLSSTTEPIYLIAERCGFKNWKRLDEAFKRIEGISPRKYRQAIV